MGLFELKMYVCTFIMGAILLRLSATYGCGHDCIKYKNVIKRFACEHAIKHTSFYGRIFVRNLILTL